MGIEENRYSIVEGGLLNVCVLASNLRNSELEVLVYLHLKIEGILLK